MYFVDCVCVHCVRQRRAIVHRCVSNGSVSTTSAAATINILKSVCFCNILRCFVSYFIYFMFLLLLDCCYVPFEWVSKRLPYSISYLPCIAAAVANRLHNNIYRQRKQKKSELNPTPYSARLLSEFSAFTSSTSAATAVKYKLIAKRDRNGEANKPYRQHQQQCRTRKLKRKKHPKRNEIYYKIK